MTRTARGRRGNTADPKRARAAHDTNEQMDASDETRPANSSRSSFWHSLLHDRSVRARVAALVIVPLLGTLILGALFFKNALDDAAAAGEVERLASVGVAATELLHRVQDERDVSGLAAADAVAAGAVASVRNATDAALAELRTRLDDVRGAGAPASSVVEAFEAEVDKLDTYRTERDAEEPAFDSGGATAYHELAEAIRGLVVASSTVVEDGETSRLISGLDDISQAVESASMERGLVTFHLTPDEEPSSSLTTNAVVFRGQQDLLIGRYLANLEAGSTEALTTQLADADALTAPTINEILQDEPVSQSHEEWYGSATERLETLREIEGEAASAVVDSAADAAGGARITAIISAAAALLVLALTVFLAIVVARSIVGPLRRLRGAAQQTATKDLPAFVERIHRDGPAATVDAGSSEAITAEGKDEIGQVAHAFNDVHAMAVRIAGDQALLRQNLDTIVVNLSRRTQSLIDRQLAELEGLEQRERDPDQLSTLFRIDHMATRVRRHAESLLVLAGVQEMRKHSSSAPVLDVVRTAVGEVEQYPRVKFGVMPTDLVSSSAVDDIAHLLAELIDNATEFSAPTTPVRVTSQPLLGGGLRIQVTDAGLGVSQDQLAALNDRLANVGDIDVATSRTLGLYVVARLSAKHGIRVRLEPGAGGGTVAQVDLPANLIHSPLDDDAGHSAPVEDTSAMNFRHRPGNLAARLPAPEPARPAFESDQFPAPDRDVVERPTQPIARPEPVPSPTGFAPQRLNTEPPAPSFPPSVEDTHDSPIFESVRSAWFSGDTSSDWSSPADAGWRRAAEVLRSAEEAAAARRTQQPPAPPAPGRRHARPGSADPATAGRGAVVPQPSRADAPAPAAEASVAEPVASGTPQPSALSPSGLPVRRRGASLVPGSIAEPSGPDAARRRPATPTKSADSVSSTLASLQRGVGRGRQETGGWVPKRPGNPERSKQ